ncbi:MAG: pilus assembly PilX N-terminal domain-containing protein [Acidobacteriota bacterium]
MNNQKGSMLVVVIMLLALLSIMGVASIRTSNTELEIATNNLIRKRCFFNAESGITSTLRLLPSILDDEDQIENATLDWQGSISNVNSPPFFDVSIMHEMQDGKVLFYGDTNEDYLLEYNTDGIGYPVEIVESHGTDYRGGKAVVNVGVRYEEAFPMPKAALWVGDDVYANGVSGSVLGEGPPGEEDKCEEAYDILHNSPLSVIDYTGDTGPSEKIDQDLSLYPYPLISNYFSRSPLLSESQYSNETFGSPENPGVFRAEGDLEIRASDGYVFFWLKEILR